MGPVGRWQKRSSLRRKGLSTKELILKGDRQHWRRGWTCILSWRSVTERKVTRGEGGDGIRGGGKRRL